jgi:hypothetical protein
MAKKIDKKINICSMDERYSDCVVKLLEAGKTVDEICGAFPEYDEQIRKFCELFMADKIAQDCKLRPVGRKQDPEPRLRPAGAPNFGLFDPLRYIISKRKVLAAAAAGFVLLVAGNAAWLAAHSGTRAVTQTTNDDAQTSAADGQPAQNIMSTEGDRNTAAMPEPTGKIDDAVAAINGFAAQEDSTLSGEDNDAKLIISDNSTIDNFGTVYPQDLSKISTCADIKNLIASAAKNMADRQSSQSVAQAGRLNTIIGGRNSRDNHLEAQRSAADSLLKRDYDKMILVAEGGAQKQGVADFTTAAGAAIAARREAIDAAQSAFRTGYDQMLMQRMVSVKNAADALAAAANPALTQASQNCQGQGAQASISSLQGVLNLALQNFSSAKSSIESQSADPLVAARDSAIKNASDAFAGSIQQAVQSLKALGF